MGPQSIASAAQFATRLYQLALDGKAVVVHCRQDIGRSSAMVACVLVMAGMDSESAFNTIRSARGIAVPETADQREWVNRFAQTADQLLEL